MKIFFDGLRIQYRNRQLSEMSIEAVSQFVYLPIARQIKMGNLGICMHSGVRAAGSQH